MSVNSKIAQLSIRKFAELYAKQAIKTDFFITDDRPLLDLSAYPYRSAGYIIGICTSGSATVEVNLQNYQAAPDALLLATPFHILRIYNRSEDFRCRFVVFSKEFLAAVSSSSRFIESFSFFKTTSAPVLYTNKETGSLLLNSFNFIEQTLLRDELRYTAEICRSALTTMLYLIADVYERQHCIIHSKLSRKQEISMQFHNLVFNHYKEHRSVHYYAEQLYVTPKHLTETVKEMTGKTAGEWIDDAIILEAKVLLRNSGTGIAQVANLLNFPDQSSFGKFFKKHTGYAPTEFRVLAHT